MFIRGPRSPKIFPYPKFGLAPSTGSGLGFAQKLIGRDGLKLRCPGGKLFLRKPWTRRAGEMIASRPGRSTMSIVIISRGSYSHGREVAEKAARQLGFECISRDFLLQVSKEYNVPEVKLTQALTNSPSVLDRYTFGRERYTTFIKAAILEHLKGDNIVYHGFAGQFFVKDIAHVLKVRITAGTEDRLKCLMHREQITRPQATKMIAKIDAERAKWSMKLYGIDSWDSRLYDLVINIGRITIDEAVDMIRRTVQLSAFQTTPDSQRQIETLAREAQEKLREDCHKTPFLEPMRAAPWCKKQ
jgi:cytidylate kinase